MREKEPIVCNTDYGKDEDSAEVSDARAACRRANSCRLLQLSLYEDEKSFSLDVSSNIKKCALLLQALLKKHEALMSDIDAYGGVIDQLREQAQACKVRTKISSFYVAASLTSIMLLLLLKFMLNAVDYAFLTVVHFTSLGIFLNKWPPLSFVFAAHIRYIRYYSLL